MCVATITPLVGNPIHAGTGNKFQTESDLSSSAANGINFTRYYNSYDDRTGSLGSNWRHNYGRRVEVASDRSVVSVIRADGKTYTFTPSGTDWVTDPDVTSTLTETTTGWTYRLTSGTVEQFDTAGRLISVIDVQGRAQTLTHDVAGSLASVTDAYGRSLTFTYDAQNRISRITAPDGDYQFAYDTSNNLAQVTYPDGTARQYLYENTSFPHALTGIIDENNVRYATWTYDAEGRATSSERAGGAEHVTLVYNADGTTTVTEANGQVRTYHFSTLHGVMKVTQIDGGPCSSCSGTANDATYDANGFLASKTDFNGNVTRYVNNSRGLQVSRTEAMGTPQEGTVTTEWHAAFSLPTRITAPGKVTDFVYDTNGNLLFRTETDSATGATRTTAYTYNSLGQILTVDGPRTDLGDVATLGYDNQGNLTTITNALGHITQITAHDASGRPLSMTDPNGLVTTLSYDARGRVLSRNVGGDVTDFDYDNAGNVARITLPDNTYVDYHYDAAQRLTGMTDQLGNRIDYQLDAAGNRTDETVSDNSGVIVQTRHRVYDELNQLIQTIGAAGQTTSYGYDANGNRISTVDARNNPTSSAFDALNRLTAVTDALNGTAQYAYDNRGNLTSVTDPNGNTTAYVYDGLGNLTSQTSPDTGTTTFTYDAAGNALSRTDAMGQTATYQYDALNRVVRADYADGKTVQYTYDTAVNGIGRLSSITNASGSTRWNYDQQGHISNQTQTIDNVDYTTWYQYGVGDRLSGMTYPSGLQLSYSYTNGKITRIDVDGQPLIANIQYDALGDVTQWHWGVFFGGQAFYHTRSYDQDGQLIAQSLVGDNRSLAYDPIGNITAINSSQVEQAFGYDALGRLVSANDANNASLDRSMTYDANGNRLQLTMPGGAPLNYTYEAGSNRLDVAGFLNVTLDANGNTTQGRQSYQYNSRNRLIQASLIGSVSSYHYNGLGQRISKTAGTTVTHYTYGLNGQLLSETTGADITDYLYFNGQPLALVRQGGMYYIHTDHLGTPRAVTNTYQQVVWRWDSGPFGWGAANEDPEGDGTNFSFNLRFPGQYYDVETGLHYNYFRYYDPRTGRYITSDPIGIIRNYNASLLYGLNQLYAYVDSNPINYSDMYGLDRLCGPGMKSVPDPNNGAGVYLCESDGSDPNEKICLTGECVTGLPSAKIDVRTQCEMNKDQCLFTCSFSSSLGGGVLAKALGGGLIVAGGVFAERQSVCQLICGVQNGF